MNHEDFPVKGFEFMNEPATEDQKRIIIDLMNRAGYPTPPDCLTNAKAWPDPFSKWDAGEMIENLRAQIGDT